MTAYFNEPHIYLSNRYFNNFVSALSINLKLLKTRTERNKVNYKIQRYLLRSMATITYTI